MKSNAIIERILYKKASIRAAIYVWYRVDSKKKALRIFSLGRRPIIIGGCGRSGTTLLLSILSSHPRIFAIGKETYGLCRDDLRPPVRFENIYKYLLENEIPNTCERWCEKTPKNVLYFDKILRHYGKKARLIHIVRDGRDVVISRHPRQKGTSYVNIDRWVSDVSAGKRFEKHPQVLTVKYEDLILNYENIVRRICEFLEEEFVPEFLSYPKFAKVKRSTAWASAKATGISVASIEKWKKPEYKSIAQEFSADSEALKLLQHYGYEVD